MAAKKKPAKKTNKKRPAPKARPIPKAKPRPKLEGEYQKDARLDSVIPNDWNPNKLKGRKYAAVKRSIQEDGWLESEPILVWRTDNRGKKQMVIIDGEHRWKIGNELGLETAPMVFLDKVTRAKAIELTIMLDHNRGEFEKQPLLKALNEIVPGIPIIDDTASPASYLGFEQSEMDKLLAQSSNAPVPGGSVTSENSVSKTVPIYLDNDVYKTFMSQVKKIGEELELETISDVVKQTVKTVYDQLTQEL